MDAEKSAPIIGIVLLAIGIIVLFFTFFQAFSLVNGAGDYFDEQFPGEDSQEGPRSRFSWSSNDLTVDFSDESEEGDAGITSWDWDFDDGGSSSEQNPMYTYSNNGNYRVSLKVRDANDETSTSYTELYVETGNQNNGESEFDDSGFEFDIPVEMFAAAFLVGILFIVMFLVGAALVKAGWNLIKPGPSTVKLKIRPKKLEIEQPQDQRAPYYEPPQRPMREPYPDERGPPPEYWDEPPQGPPRRPGPPPRGRGPPPPR